MSTRKNQTRPTVDVNRNGIQLPFPFRPVETPIQKAYRKLKSNPGRKFSQLKLPV